MSKIILLFVLALLLLFGVLKYSSISEGNSNSNKLFKSTKSTKNPSQTTSFNKQQFPIDVSSSLWVVVNKGRILPSTYKPGDLQVPAVALRLSSSSTEMMLRRAAAESLQKLFEAANKAGLPLKLTSGYRSYSDQAVINNRNAASQGQAIADATSARAGHSEHQTGLAADIEPLSGKCQLDKCFGSTPEGIWVAANAANFGFLVRYPADKIDQTGYDYEPWHLRYVGQDLASNVYSQRQSLEAFFGLPYYTGYPSTSFQLK